MAGDHDLLVAAEGVDLPLHCVHVGDRRGGEVSAPNERRKLVQERLAGSEVTGAGPCLDEGRALPGLALALVVSDSKVDRDCELGRTRIRSQAQMTRNTDPTGALYSMLPNRAPKNDKGRGIDAVQLGCGRRTYIRYR